MRLSRIGVHFSREVIDSIVLLPAPEDERKITKSFVVRDGRDADITADMLWVLPSAYPIPWKMRTLLERLRWDEVLLLSVVLAALTMVVLALTLLLGTALFAPLVLTIDSTSSQMRLRWLVILEYWRPPPFGTELKRTHGDTGLSQGYASGSPRGKQRPLHARRDP